MHMLYNSDSYAVVRFDVPAVAASTTTSAVPLEGQGVAQVAAQVTRGGYEIVDKLARKEIFIEGAMAQSFQEGVEKLIERGPSEEEIDEFLAGFAQMATQPVVLH